MKWIRFDSIRLNLILVVLFGALPMLAMILWSGAELREKEVRDAKIEALRIARSFGEQQESVTLGVKQLLSTLSLVHDIHHDPSACARLFKALVQQNPVHANIALLAPNGDVIASALPFSKANFSDQKHVAETMKTREFAAGEYLVGRLSGEPVLAFAYPVLDQRGELDGILTTSLKLDGFVGMFDAAMLPPDASLGINDGNGTRLLFYPYKPQTNPVGEKISPQAMRDQLGPEEEGVVFLTTQDGVRRYSAFRQLRLTPHDPPYLMISIGIPEAEILSRADQVTRRYLLWFALALSVSLAAAWLTGKYGIINPLRRFAAQAKRVGEGDLDAVSGMAGGSGTLNTVATAFDGMTKALKERENERNRAEDALRESGERFRQVVEGTDNLITRVDGDGRFLYVNPVASKVLGLEPEECIGRVAFEVVHEDDREATRRAFGGWIADKKHHVRFENRLVSRSGDVRQMSWTSDLHYDGAGNATFIDSIAQDITERKKAEEASRESEARFRLLFENAPLPYQSLDERGYFLDVNKKWLETLGYAKEEVIGRWFGDFLGKGFVEHFDRNFPMFKQACVIDGVEFDMVAKNGQTMRVAFNGRVQLGNEGEFLRTHCIFTDITERKKSEEAIAASLREKEVLLREIHHRVKNNLQIISSLLNLQEEGLDDQAALDALAASRGRVASMAMIHEQLYRSEDLSGIDAAGYLRQFVPRLVATYKGAQNITLAFETPPVTLALDQAIPFGLIVNELTTNAIKHAFKNRDHSTITISTSLNEEKVTLVVADDGVGLPANFEELKMKSLGLQLVTMLTKQLRGELAVDSGAGTAFRLTFPHRPGPP
jgi:PAS domain S-box-containing protein